MDNLPAGRLREKFNPTTSTEVDCKAIAHAVDVERSRYDALREPKAER